MKKIITICTMMLFGCSAVKAPEIQYPDRLPITEQAKELTLLPVYQPPIEGRAKALQLDDPAPFDGILFGEEKAFAAAKLRVSYDKIFQLALVDRRYLISIVEIQEKELYRADQIIDYKESQLKKIRDSWWARNKLSMGIALGLCIGAALAFGAGKVWAAIEEDHE